MTEPTTDELADKLASLRRKMVAAATDQTTPEQRAEWKAADEAMAQRIRKARPGILPHHVLATLETLRAIQRYDAGAEPMTDERAAELLAPLEAKARALHAQKDAEHRAVVLREAADIAESLRQFEHATGARWSAQVSENVGILRVADELRRMADAASGPGGAADETQQDETQAEAHPPAVTWQIESPRRDTWTRWSGTRDTAEEAREDYDRAVEWGGERRAYRLVEAATAYTVVAEHQPAAVSQPGKEA